MLLSRQTSFNSYSWRQARNYSFHFRASPRTPSPLLKPTAAATTATMHVILDFDGTITVHDTIDHLAAFAVEFQEKQKEHKSSSDSNVDWDGHWKEIVDNYLADHRDHKAAYSPAEDARTTLDHELEFIRSLHGVDCRSIKRLRDAGLFAGMSPAPEEHLFEAGQKAADEGFSSKKGEEDKDSVRVRPGFSRFLRETSTNRKWPVSIVSVNWSDAWIQGVLSREDDGGPGDDGPAIRVFANKVTESGAIIPNFRRKDATTAVGEDHEHDDNVPFASCSDKVEALETAVAEAEAASGSSSIDDAVLYMGDSVTDLECLVLAGSKRAGGGGGIAIANGDGPATSKLIQTLVRLGYEVPHVSESKRFQRPRSEDEGDAPRLAWARDYEEILASKVLD